MSDNLKIYNGLREVPEEARTPITGGKLKGFTNIAPQWRYQALTEAFGPCGIGWKYDKPEYRFVTAGETGEIVCFCDTNLYFKLDGEWSDPIPGEGGSKFISKVYSGLDVSDECCKMALTDAISTAAQKIGLAANIYWAEGCLETKYESMNDDGSFRRFGEQAQQSLPNPVSAQNVAAVQPTVQSEPIVQNVTPTLPTTVRQPANPNQNVNSAQEQVLVCSECGAPIDRNVYDYSTNVFKRALCYSCQSKARASNRVMDGALMDRRQALTHIIPTGKYAGKTLSEIIATDRKAVEMFANDSNGRFSAQDPMLVKAARAVLANI